MNPFDQLYEDLRLTCDDYARAKANERPPFWTPRGPNGEVNFDQLEREASWPALFRNQERR